MKIVSIFTYENLVSAFTCSIIPMFYYGPNDISIGDFLQRYCFRYRCGVGVLGGGREGGREGGWVGGREGGREGETEGWGWGRREEEGGREGQRVGGGRDRGWGEGGRED
jgi:hypothetical protein